MLFLPRQTNSCITCPSPPPCNCAANQQCFQFERSCSTCSYYQCVASSGSSRGANSGGISQGTLAGAVIGSLLLLAAAIALFLWYRRRASTKPFEEKADIPAPAATVLSRRDPTEKSISITELDTVRVHNNPNVDRNPPVSQPASVAAAPSLNTPRNSTQTNPFEDNHSIQTTGTGGTNAIPIALVPAPSLSSEAETSYGSPSRPQRSPELNLNLEHVNISRDSIRATSPISQASGASRATARQSFMSAASYTSDFLNEAPMIITPTKGAFRQVLGVVKAEVINTQGSASPTTSSTDTLKPPRTSRPPVGSPLASASFGPCDVGDDSIYGRDLSTADPFGDEHSARASSDALSHAAVKSSIGTPSDLDRDSTASEWTVDGPKLPWTQSGDFSRPSSMSTQAGSVIDISNATRVNVGLSSAYSPLSAGFPRSPFRTTMGRLVTPPMTSTTAGLEQQQQMALAHAQARAQAQGLDHKRISGSSVLSAASASTRADSILESFPFVPPNPISNLPLRSPPCSPLSQQSFSKQSPKEALRTESSQSDLPPPPSRSTLGLSTASQLSTSSTGLGSFAFQIDSGNTQDMTPPQTPPLGSLKGRQRASLDTLALTSDLSSYPLAFDQDMRDSFPSSDKS
jgi:hypothetical protein